MEKCLLGNHRLFLRCDRRKPQALDAVTPGSYSLAVKAYPPPYARGFQVEVHSETQTDVLYHVAAPVPSSPMLWLGLIFCGS